MRQLRRFLLLFLACAFTSVLSAYGQDDSPSLGDVARQSRQQKQKSETQAKDAQTKDATQTPLAKDAPKDGQGNAPAEDKDKGAAVNDTQPGKAPHVITNDDISDHVGPTQSPTPGFRTSPVTEQPASDVGKTSAEQWKSQILSQKNAIASLQSQVDQLSASIQYAPSNCVSGCVQANERAQQKRQQVDSMKAQLEQMQQRLEDMQEAARKQGYGSSVYDP
jgi:hypothetical protein